MTYLIHLLLIDFNSEFITTMKEGDITARRINYQQQNYQEKQNIPLKVNYDLKRDRKYTYDRPQSDTNENVQKQQTHQTKLMQTSTKKVMPRSETKDEQIERLKQELQQERKKSKYLQTNIIEQQTTVLKHLQTLQRKFQEVTSQKRHLEVEVHRLKNDQNKVQPREEKNQWEENYKELQRQHKKIKKIADSLIDMMKKVDGVEGSVHEAWKWCKKVVWQYESIRKKALQWKTVYDQVTEAIPLIEH